MSQLYASLFYQQDVTKIFSDVQLVSYMIDAEVALAKAQAQTGIIPETAAKIIETAAKDAIAQINFDDLATATGLAGNVAIPFVKQFTAIVKKSDEDAARYVHWGATSQDILDTACILQCRDALTIVQDLVQQCYETALLQAENYRHQVMIGRTWLQQALPITLGHKLARWASVFKRDLDRIETMKSRVLVAQLGGAVGSLASLQKHGSAVTQAYAATLGLDVANCTWHGERDRIVEIASSMGIITGSVGKMARDWSLMMQTEIAEVFEPTAKGRGGSSTMPHKRNPVAAASILAAANRVPALMSSIYQSLVQEHERGLGGWHAEWLAIPEIFQLTAGALERTLDVLKGMEVHRENMQRNIECTHGLIMAEAVMMALAPHIGRLNAHHIVEDACKKAVSQHVHLKDIISQANEVKEYFNENQLEDIFKPESYFGNIQDQIDAVLQDAKGAAK